MIRKIAELRLVPEADLIDEQQTLSWLLEWFDENPHEQIEITFVINKEDVQDFKSKARPDIKRWVIVENAETE